VSKRGGRLPLVALACTLLFASVTAPPGARAHTFPETRRVVAQLEPCGAALLVAWNPPSGLVGDLLIRYATHGRVKARARSAMRSLYTTRALAPLALSWNGSRVTPQRVEAKLSEDPVGSGRLVLLALVTFDLPSQGGELRLDVRDPVNTLTQWVDRSQGRVVMTESPPPNRPHSGLRALELVLAEARPGSCSGRTSNEVPREAP
jgi:hypothetical protein